MNNRFLNQHLCTLYQTALSHFDANEYIPAIESFTRILAIHPGHQGALRNRGIAYYSLFLLYDDTYDELAFDQKVTNWHNNITSSLSNKLMLAKADLEKYLTMNTRDGKAYRYSFWTAYMLLNINSKPVSESQLQAMQNKFFQEWDSKTERLRHDNRLTVAHDRVEFLTCQAEIKFEMGKVGNDSHFADSIDYFAQALLIDPHHSESLKSFIKLIDYFNYHTEIENYLKDFNRSVFDRLPIDAIIKILEPLERYEFAELLRFLVSNKSLDQELNLYEVLIEAFLQLKKFSKAANCMQLFLSIADPIKHLQFRHIQRHLFNVWAAHIQENINKLEVFEELADYEELNLNNEYEILHQQFFVASDLIFNNADNYDAGHLLKNLKYYLLLTQTYTFNYVVNYANNFSYLMDALIVKFNSAGIDPVFMEFFSRSIIKNKNKFAIPAGAYWNGVLDASHMLYYFRAGYKLPDTQLTTEKNTETTLTIKNLDTLLHDDSIKADCILELRIELVKFYFRQRAYPEAKEYLALVDNAEFVKMILDLLNIASGDDAKIRWATTELNYKRSNGVHSPDNILFIFENLITSNLIPLAEKFKSLLIDLNIHGQLGMLQQERFTAAIAAYENNLKESRFMDFVRNGKFSDLVINFFKVANGQKEKAWAPEKERKYIQRYNPY